MIRKTKNLLLQVSFALLLFSACTRDAVTANTENASQDHTTSAARTQARNEELVTTVARINRLANGDVEYNFNEKQAIFTVTANDPLFSRILSIATEAKDGKKPVKLSLASFNTLADLVWPTADETARYLDWYRNNIPNPEADRPIRLSELDSAYFNYEDWQNWKVFRLCFKTVPSFAAAQTIFNYCAAQGCYLGPTQEQPCIPFQYVKDGCFARAHKMRKIIEQKFGYCSEKVFSYGNLDVKADKWGGCCVGWWYHVAPLIRVKGRGGKNYCYVIDPGMFNGPVLLSTWLAAQSNNTCDGTSSLTSYSIQPSSAYTPSYTTDPTYTATNADLVYYNNLGPTCDN